MLSLLKWIYTSIIYIFLGVDGLSTLVNFFFFIVGFLCLVLSKLDF